jgi:hypothetical protein
MGIKTAAYEQSANPAKVKEAGVNGFPTIRLTVDGKTSDYNGERTVDSIIGAVSGQSGGYYQYDQSGQYGGQRGGKVILDDDEDDEYYKMKYLKYKAKYLKLRS